MENTNLQTNNSNLIFGIPAIAMRGKTVFPNVITNIDVGRTASLNAINSANAKDKLIFVVSQKDQNVLEPKVSDLYTVGTVCRVGNLTMVKPTNNYRLSIEGMFTARIVSSEENKDYFCFNVEKFYPEISGTEIELEGLFRAAKTQFKETIDMLPNINVESMKVAMGIDNPMAFVNVASFNVPVKNDEKQKILECTDLIEKYNLLLNALAKEKQIIEIEKTISQKVKANVEKNQKEFYLREQLKAIHEELGDDVSEIERLKEQVKQKGLDDVSLEKVMQELKRMSKMAPSSPDFTVLRSYIDWILDVPFTEESVDTEKLSKCQEILEDDHFGLEKVKERIIEYLAVLKLTKSLKGPILCLVGPPGVGKTSVAKSVARALNRKLVRMSLGGVKDEAEIRGHRKTYIGAMPGRIIYGMKEAGTINPVFLLDEIDKLSQDLRGDPASALLEVLDPEQNTSFRDRYLEISYDLSKVMFITTANSIDTIPAPLLDRMEVINIAGYTEEEKVQIAKRYLIPKNLKANGLDNSNVKFTDDGIKAIIRGYTGEAGVRKLEQLVSAVIRKVATKVAGDSNYPKQTIKANNVSEYLGIEKYSKEDKIEKNQVGSATGLAWTSVGGVTLTIEVALMKGKGNLLLTGKLGDVMKESAQTAISFIRSNADKYNIDSSIFETSDVHVHVPEGATPKDGPSAGITIATALISAFTGKKVKRDVAMTGEITLRGNVLAIGGLKEKALAAYRLGIRTIVIPKSNLKDLEEIPSEIVKDIKFIGAENIAEVFETALEK